ncbi:MAG: ATP-binding protein, partial [bacterium]
MAVFYGLTAENLVTDRGDRRVLEERLEKLKRVQAGILKRSRELEHHVDTLKAERARLQAQVRVRPSQTQRADNGVMQHARLETAIRLGEGLAKGLEADLSVIGTHSSRLLMWLAQEEAYRQPMEAIFQAGDRLATKVGDLRAFTQLDASERELLSLNVVVGALEPIFRGQLGDDIDVHFALQPDLPLIQADPVHLERSVLYLIRNAQEAMPLGGDLTIETKTVQLQASSARQYPGVSPGEYVRLSIQDTGCGMEPETKAHMFEPFFSTKSHGPGLGLSLVYALTQKAGGLLTVDSHLG